jgi:hypothetical protein
MCTGRAELLTSPIIPVTSPGIEPTVDVGKRPRSHSLIFVVYLGMGMDVE